MPRQEADHHVGGHVARELAMYKRFSAVLTTGSVALTMGLTATSPPAVATTTTWTVKPGGSFSVSGSGDLKDAKTGEPVKCTSIKLAGMLKSGSGLSGSGIGSVTSASFNHCATGAIPVTVSIGSGSLPWEVNALKYDPTTGVTTGSLEDIDLKYQFPAFFCNGSLHVDGTAADANNGLIKLSYNNGTGNLKLLGPGGNLHSWAVTGCSVYRNGDAQKPSGNTAMSPEQKITSP